MRKILILLGMVCSLYSNGSQIYGSINVFYDGNNSKINNLSILIKNNFQRNLTGYKYNLEFDFSNQDKTKIKQANISLKNNLGEVIIGNTISRNYLSIYKSLNDFEFMKVYKNNKYTIKNNLFKVQRFNKNQISYIFPSIYHSISEIDYSIKDKKTTLRNIWTKNNLQTSIYYQKENNNTKKWAMALYYKTQTSIASYIYENNIKSHTAHSFSLTYIKANYYFKSLYVYNSLEKDIIINGVDIFFLKEKKRIAKIYFESIIQNDKDKSIDDYVIGGFFRF